MEILILIASILLAGTLTGLCFLVLLAWVSAQLDDRDD